MTQEIPVLEAGLHWGEDGRVRCGWHGGLPDYLLYHDTEWGYPVDNDRRLFEKICLEGFQSGLSWLTILRKRENFRRAFAEFDFHKMALFTDDDVERLMQDAGIVRHRGKIKSAINNAGRAIERLRMIRNLLGQLTRPIRSCLSPVVTRQQCIDGRQDK